MLDRMAAFRLRCDVIEESMEWRTIAAMRALETRLPNDRRALQSAFNYAFVQANPDAFRVFNRFCVKRYVLKNLKTAYWKRLFYQWKGALDDNQAT